MQLIAEAYSLLNVLQKGDHEATAQTFESWNKGVLDSYLIGITAPILRYKDTDGKSLIDKIADRAGQKGTGKWSIEAAIDSGTTLSVTAESVFARLLSNRTTERNKAHRLYPETNPAPIYIMLFTTPKSSHTHKGSIYCATCPKNITGSSTSPI